MGRVLEVERKAVMASRWRRRRMCVLVGERPAPAALREISARGAFLETGLRPDIGTEVELRHPEAGMIGAHIVSVADDGRFVVTWTDHFDVFARRFTPSCTPIGAPWMVNTTTAAVYTSSGGT